MRLTFQVNLEVKKSASSTSDPAAFPPAIPLGAGRNTTFKSCCESASWGWIVISGRAGRLLSLWSSETRREHFG